MKITLIVLLVGNLIMNLVNLFYIHDLKSDIDFIIDDYVGKW